MSLIKAKALTKHYKQVKAVDAIDLEVEKGEYIALLGPNGAGKSTLIEMLEGVLSPDSGNIAIDNKTWAKDADSLRRLIGVSFQETRFMDKVTVWETLTLFASFYQVEKDRIEFVLSSVGLTDKKDTFVVNLSGGQRQKLALGLAIMNDPKILFLDEPTTGLDPRARREIWDILRSFKKEGKTLILTTHYMEEAEVLCDRILIMFAGKILAQGTLDELIGAYGPSQSLEITFEQKPSAKWIKRISENEKIEAAKLKVEENKLYFQTDDASQILQHLYRAVEKEGVAIQNVQCKRLTLDDLFILMTGTHLHE